MAPTPYDNRLSAIDVSEYRGQVGAHWRQLREAKIRYQTDFADELQKHGMKVSKQSVSNWEHGTRFPIELNDWPLIAAVLGVGVEDLLPPYIPSRSKR
jgi:transcriptional regulator with XRE-family HTH domain